MLHFNTTGSEVMPMLLKSLLVLHVQLISHLPCGMGLWWELLKSMLCVWDGVP